MLVNPQDYSHVVSLNFTNTPIIYGLTNNPHTMTIKHIQKIFQKSDLDIMNRNMPIAQNNIYFRNQDSDNDHDSMKTPVHFTNNIANIDVIIKIKVNEDTYYIPTNNTIPEYDYNYQQPSNKSFQIFIDTTPTIQCMVSTETQIGEIADYIFRKTKTLMHTQRLIHCGKQMDFNKTVADYHIKHMSNIIMVVRLRGGMFHLTSGRDDYKPYEPIYMSLD